MDPIFPEAQSGASDGKSAIEFGSVRTAAGAFPSERSGRGKPEGIAEAGIRENIAWGWNRKRRSLSRGQRNLRVSGKNFRILLRTGKSAPMSPAAEGKWRGSGRCLPLLFRPSRESGKRDPPPPAEKKSLSEETSGTRSSQSGGTFAEFEEMCYPEGTSSWEEKKNGTR